MNSEDPTLVIILSEIIIFQMLIIIAIISFYILKNRKKAKLLGTISTKVTEEVNDREQVIHNSLKGLPSISDNKLKAVAQTAVKGEMEFYQYIIDLLHSNKIQPIEAIKESVENLVSPYLQLATGDGGDSSSDNTDTGEPIIPNVDDAIDDFLGDDDDDDESNKDPEFDLSKQDEIAEIPDNLLEGGDEEKAES